MPKISKASISIMAALSATLSFTLSSSVLAADLDGAKLFTEKTCHSCHGKDASTPVIAAYPSIAGQAKEYLVQQIKDIKEGKRNNGQTAAMKGIMHLVSDEEIDAIATYVSSLPYKPGRAVSKAPTKEQAAASTAAAAAGAATAAGTASTADTAKPATPSATTADTSKEAAASSAPAAAATPSATATTTPSAAGKEGKLHDGSNEKVWMTEGGERIEAMHLTPDHENGIEVFEVCSGCHLTEGWGQKDGTFPQLAGQHQSVLIKQLADIRSKNRDNPTMYPFALPESIGGTQAMADVTAYIAKLPMNPDNGKGEWEKGTPEYDQGAKLYKDNCVKCHGEEGRGDAEKFYPRLQGQHYKYMLRQFQWIRDGKRRNANPDMVKQINGFSDKEMEMVINYVSRIPVPKEELAPSVDYLNPDYD